MRMGIMLSTIRAAEGLLAGMMLLLSCQLVTAETLADIDSEIQSEPSFKTDRGGLDADNIYQGVTESRLDRKISLLQTAAINRRFYQNGAGAADYTNFYSFTGRAGVTDTQLELVTTGSPLRLYRRGNSGAKEASSYLGSWWSDRYRGIEASRDQLAILTAWGSDLQGIYVVDVPAGNTLVGGLTSPMARNGEYRPGGGQQYYYRGAPSDWLVYALYAPDYLKSYSGAIIGAQKAGRGLATDLGAHLDQTRYHLDHPSVAGNEEGQEQEGELWLRGFGGDLDYDQKDGTAVDSQVAGMSIGWQRPLSGLITDHSKATLGLMFGQGVNVQQYPASAVENTARATVGGIYGVYVNRPNSPRSWYGSGSLLYGGLRLNNTVPGELGYGLNQDYDGDIGVLTMANGLSCRQHNGWVLEPQQQFSYTKIGLSDFNDQLGAPVSLQQGDSFWGRWGIELRKTLGQENRSNLWTRLSYIRDFSSDNEVRVAGDLAKSAVDPDSYEAVIGTDWRFNPQLSLQGQVARVFAGEQGWQGNLALHYTW